MVSTSQVESDLRVTIFVQETGTVQEVAWRLGDGAENPVSYDESPFTFTISDVPFGSGTVTVLATDGAGNTGTASFEYTRADETPPVLSLEAPADSSVTDTAAVRVAGSVEDANGVERIAWSVEGGPSGETVLEGQEAASFETFLELADGPRALTVTAVDLAGNETAAQRRVTVDTRAPSVGAANLRTGDTVRADSAMVTLVAVDSLGLASASWAVDGGSFTSLQIETRVEVREEIRLPELESGTHEVTLRATDRAGNRTTATLEVVADASEPEVERLVFPDGTTVAQGGFTFEIKTDSPEDVARVTARVDGELRVLFEREEPQSQKEGPHGPLSDVQTESGFRFTLDDLGPGSHTVEICVADAVGNQVCRTLEITVDSQGPAVSIERPSPGDTLPRDTVLVLARATDAEGLNVLRWRLDGGPWNSTRAGGNQVELNRTLEPVSVGSHTLLVEAVDQAGNQASASVSFHARSSGGPAPDTADVAVSASSNTPVRVGDTLLLANRVENRGPDTARGVILTDSVPASLSAAAAPCQVSGPLVNCSLGDLAPGQDTTVLVPLEATSPDTAQVPATVGAATVDPDASNDRTAHGFVAFAPSPDSADVSLTLSADTAAQIGDTVELSATVSNAGPDTATSITLRDSVPASFSPQPHAFCTVSSGMVTCPLGTLPPTGDTTVTLDLLATAVDTARVVGVATAATVEPDSSDNAATAVTVISAGSTQPPAVTFTSPADSAVVASQTVTVSGHATDDQQVDSLTRELNGGGQTSLSPTPADSVAFSFQATLTTGFNELVVRAWDQADLLGADTLHLDYAQPPTASLSATAAQAGQASTFDATGSSDPQGRALSYQWAFGDGDRGSAATLAHIYDAAGTYDVTLTVTNGAGLTDTASTQLSVGSPPPPISNNGVVDVLVLDQQGDSLSGVTVTHPGSGTTATTDANGEATLTGLPVGPPVLLELTASGYVTNQASTVIPQNANGYVQARMVTAGATTTLTDSENGGEVTGDDGSRIELPDSALVDSNGNPVTGDVQVTTTGVDVSTDEIEAFPGGFGAVDSTGSSGVLSSYGVVDFDLTQGGQELDLADGKTATIEIPIYTSGASVGQTIPLWSLDESNGVWVQEGVGTVVSASGTPTGLALEAKIGHLSWWNCDIFDEPFTFDFELRAPDGSSPEGRLTATSSGAGPGNRATGGVASGGSSLSFPPNRTFDISAAAQNGLLSVDTSLVAGAGGASQSVTLILESTQLSAADTLRPGDSIRGAIDPAGEVDEYVLVGDDGEFVNIRADHTPNSQLQGRLVLLDANDDTLREDSFTSGFVGSPAEFSVTLGAQGYLLQVDGFDNEPGTYDLVVRGPDTLGLNVVDTATITDGRQIGYALESGGLDSVRLVQNGSLGEFSNHDGTCLDVEFVDPSGTVAWSHVLTCNSQTHDEVLDTVVPLPTQGTWTVLMENVNGGGEGYESSFRFARPAPLDTLALGDSIRGTIDPEWEIDSYALTGPQGDYIQARIVGEGVGGRGELLSAARDTLNRAEFTSGFFGEDAHLLTQAGSDVRLLDVVGDRFGTGDYDVIVERPDTLEFQTPENRELIARGYTGYFVRAQGYDTLRVQQTGSASGAGDCLTMEVRQVGSSPFMSRTLSCSETLDTLLALPDTAGTYLVTATNELSDRQYNSSVEVEGWDPRPLPLDTTVTDSIREERWTWFSVDAQAGDTLALGAQSGVFNPTIQLSREDRTQSGIGFSDWDNVFTIPADGTYLIRVDARNENISGFGSFDLGVSRAKISTLSLSRAVVDDTLRRPGSTHIYLFETPDSAGYAASLESSTGISGGQLLGNLVESGTILDPQGRITEQRGFEGGPGDVIYREWKQLTTGGGTDTYVLVVDSYREDSGPYSLTVDLVDPSSDIVVDDDLACAGATTRSFRAAALAARPGGTITLCQGVFDGPFYAQILADSVTVRGTDPTGSIVRGRTGQALRIDDARGVALDSLVIESSDGGDGVIVRDGPGFTADFVTARAAPGAQAGSGINLSASDSSAVRRSTFTGALDRGVEASISSHLSITGSRMETEHRGIYLEAGSDIVIRHDTMDISGESGDGVYHEFGSNAGGITVESNQITLRDGGTAIRLAEAGGGAGGSVVRENVVDIQGGGGVVDLRAFEIEGHETADTVWVERNRVTFNDSQGGEFLRAFAGTDGGTVLVRSNTADGVGFESIRLSDVGDFDALEFYNNTFEAAATSFTNDMPIFMVNEFSSAQGQLPVTIVNNIFVGEPGQDFVAIRGNQGDTIQADHNLFYDLDLGAYDGGIVSSLASGGSSPMGANSLTGQDPLLDGMLNLGAGSPAIDAGTGDTNLFPGLPGFDVDNAARPQGGGYDIGADEGG